MTEYDTTEKVEETRTGYKLKVKSKRGTGTRDQDEVEAQARTETFRQLREERDRLHAVVCAEMDALRKMQPDGGDDE